VRVFTLYDRIREKSFEKEWISVGYFEIMKAHTETANQEYWRQYFLGNEVPKEAPAYLRRAREVLDNVNMDDDERRIAYYAERAEQRRIGKLLAARDEERELIARNMLTEGDSIEKVSRVTGLTPEQIEKL
jgi:hypothetical protein